MSALIILTERQCVNFWAKVQKSDGECWRWTGASSAPPHHDGRYGTFSLWTNGRPRTEKAHRVMYALVHGQPGVLHVLHSCDNPICVNPDHLSLGTVKDNVDDMAAKGRDRGPLAENRRKTHCKHGHPLSGGNLYVNPRGQRQCITCRRAIQKRYKARKAVAA